MGFIVVEESLMRCSAGLTPNVLQVKSQACLKINGLLAATVMDFAPMANIGSFGICQIKTDLAEGVPQPCIPMTSSPWKPGSTVQKVNELAVLMAPATCNCDIGGLIMIQESIQAVENTD